mmetsp:Transcript_76206/g.227135  ORF Transcript_76206/g.227135 Transcript_76206/m.227135 type:complete len:305 (+) Transcript_76206:232-1146(+)
MRLAVVHYLVDLLVREIVHLPVLDRQGCRAHVAEAVRPGCPCLGALVSVVAPLVLLHPVVEGQLLLLVEASLFAVGEVALVSLVLHGYALVLVHLREHLTQLSVLLGLVLGLLQLPLQVVLGHELHQLGESLLALEVGGLQHRPEVRLGGLLPAFTQAALGTAVEGLDVPRVELNRIRRMPLHGVPPLALQGCLRSVQEQGNPDVILIPLIASELVRHGGLDHVRVLEVPLFSVLLGLFVVDLPEDQSPRGEDLAALVHDVETLFVLVEGTRGVPPLQAIVAVTLADASRLEQDHGLGLNLVEV